MPSADYILAQTFLAADHKRLRTTGASLRQPISSPESRWLEASLLPIVPEVKAPGYFHQVIPAFSIATYHYRSEAKYEPVPVSARGVTIAMAALSA